tara:strand:- start:3574 stop:4677 length:1104 start_codon:yes stop_codon:yes gene_type:complete
MNLNKKSATGLLIRYLYEGFCWGRVCLNRSCSKDRNLVVYYGGARGGDFGGTLVKVARLQKVFPERKWGFNMVYNLSNASYLNEQTIRSLKQQEIPIVHNQNGTFYPAWYGGDWFHENKRMASGFHAADYVFYQSEFCRDAARHHLGERKGPGEILYNAVDTNLFSPAERKGSSRPFTFLVTGKIDLHMWYRLESTLLGLAFASKMGKKYALTIAGWMSSNVRRLVGNLVREKNLGQQVRVQGAYTQLEAPGVYRNADAYVMMKHQDPCPNVVIEALSSGLPVLFSKSGGVPELVGNEAGIGLECELSWERVCVPSPEEIGQGMVQIVSTSDSMSEAARHRACSMFDISHWVDRHQEIFSRIQNSDA